jgi:hypothetical protein
MSVIVASVLDEGSLEIVKKRIYAQAILRDVRTSISQTKKALRSVENVKGGTSSITNYSLLVEKLSSIDALSDRLVALLQEEKVNVYDESTIVDVILSDLGPSSKEKIVSLQRLATSFGNGRVLSAWANATEHRRMFVQHSFSLCTIEKRIKKCIHDLEKGRGFSVTPTPKASASTPPERKVEEEEEEEEEEEDEDEEEDVSGSQSGSFEAEKGETTKRTRRIKFPNLSIPKFSKSKSTPKSAAVLAEADPGERAKGKGGGGEDRIAEKEKGLTKRVERRPSPISLLRAGESLVLEGSTGSFTIVQTPHHAAPFGTRKGGKFGGEGEGGGCVSKGARGGADAVNEEHVRFLLRIFNLKHTIIRMNSEKYANQEIHKGLLVLQEARRVLQAARRRCSLASEKDAGLRIEEIESLHVAPSEGGLLKTMNAYAYLQGREHVSIEDIRGLSDEDLDVLIDSYRGSSDVPIIELVRDEWEDLRTSNQAYHLLPCEYMCDYEDLHRMLDDQFNSCASWNPSALRVFNEVMTLLSRQDTTTMKTAGDPSLEEKYKALELWKTQNVGL